MPQPPGNAQPAPALSTPATPTPALPRTAAVILAAGLSSRLGEFKPLARLGDETLLERAARLLRQADVADILAVAGHRAPETLAEAERLGIRAVTNPEYATGMFSSVLAGLRAVAELRPRPDALFLLPVDVPLVRPHTLRLLLERFAASGEAPPAVLHPVFCGQRGHPPLFHARHLPELLAWDGENGLRGGLDALGERHGAEEVPVADENILFDVDDQPALAEAKIRLARRGIPTPQEALALLALHNAGERGLAHGRGVAEAALTLARALEAKGTRADVDTAFDPGPAPSLDFALIEAAALLHDIAKGQPRHEAAGAALLGSLGFHAAARIVADHRDIAPETAPRLTERELVYFADKLVRGSTRVPVRARFQLKLDLFAHDPDATAAIRRRLANALAMQQRIEAAAGAPLHRLVPGTQDT
ncbi:DVU_1551 family NTP transferase [Humidesulfovibrio sp.]